MSHSDETSTCPQFRKTRLDQMIDLISDCDGVLVSQIGPGAADKLMERGIQPIIIPISIDNAIEKVYLMMQDEE